MNTFNNHCIRALAETHFQWEDRIEIPCKDMDIDCLPDESGGVPFMSYARCYQYDSEQGLCPFLPIERKA